MLVLFVSMSISSAVAVALSTAVMLDVIDDAKFAVAIAGISWVVVWVTIVELAILACVFIVNAIKESLLWMFTKMSQAGIFTGHGSIPWSPVRST